MDIIDDPREGHPDGKGLIPNTDAEILASIPMLIGTTPHDCITVILFAGTRSVAHCRIGWEGREITADEDGELETELTKMLLQVKAQNPELDGFLLAAYSKLDALDRLIEDKCRFVARTLMSTGMQLRGAFHVGIDGWLGYHDREHSVYPLSDIMDVQMSNDVLRENTPLSDKERAQPIEKNKERRGLVLKRLLQITLTATQERSMLDKKGPPFPTEEVVDLFERALTQPYSELAIDDVVRLLILLELPPYRDLLIIQTGTSKEHIESMVDAHLDPEKQGDDMDYMSLFGRGLRPPERRLHAGVQLGRELAGEVPACSFRLGPITVATWSAWAAGLSAYALELAKVGLTVIEIAPAEAQEHHSLLPEFYNNVLRQSRLPEWLFDKEL